MITSTLAEAVKAAVNDFIQRNTEFSVHEVTTLIRSLTNSGELEIPECEISGLAHRFEITHDDVKILFNDFYANDEFSAPLNKNWGGSYFVYSTSAQPITTSLNAGNQIVQTNPTPKADRQTVVNRVRLYLTHCTARGIAPTLKQIQGAIKRGRRSTGWSKSELETVKNEVAST